MQVLGILLLLGGPAEEDTSVTKKDLRLQQACDFWADVLEAS